MYTFEVDIWTIGCVLAELALNEPLFTADTEIEQLFKIFSMLGTPEDWTTAGNIGEARIEFPKWQQVNISHAALPRKSDEFMQLCDILIPSREAAFQKLLRLSSVLGMEGMNLLEMLLNLDPQRRPTTEAVLSHPFFTERVYQVQEPCYMLDAVSNSVLEHTWETLIKNESLYRPKKDYMSQQTSVNDKMRSILIDWLIDVSIHFELSNETLHLAVAYLDRVLSEKIIDRPKLQLLGVTCMKIADVFNQRSKEYYRQENAKEYAYITAEEYTEAELLETEKSILMLMKFRLYSPTNMHFLKLYQLALKVDEATQILSNYLADLSLLNCETTNFTPSLLASAILCFSCYVLHTTPPPELLQEVMKTYGIYTWSEFEKAVVYVKQAWLLAKTTETFSKFDAMNNKYDKQTLVNIKSIWPPSVTHSVIENWIYPKMLTVRKDTTKAEPMEID